MKQLTLKLVTPLTFISFVTYTKWWYTLPVDAPDTMFYGFPLIYYGEGWGASMSTQFFIIEFFIDLFVYFLFWFILIFLINRFVVKIKIPEPLSIFNRVLVYTFVVGTFLSMSNPDDYYKLKRGFDVEVMDSGSKFIWQHIKHPDYYKYHPEKS